MPEPTLIFLYRNYRGETSVRRVTDLEPIVVQSTPHHPVAQPILSAFDMDKKARRSFAVNDILAFLHDAKTTPIPEDRHTILDIYVKNGTSNIFVDKVIKAGKFWRESETGYMWQWDELLYWRLSP